MDLIYKKEIWSEIINFSNYLVSNYGRIWSKHRKKIRVLMPNKDGYLGLLLRNDNEGKEIRLRTHRIVIFTFKGNPPNLNDQVRHFPDPNVTNNYVDNLHWGSAVQNKLDSIKYKGCPTNQFGDGLTEEKVIQIKKRILSGIKYSDIMKEFDINEINVIKRLKYNKTYWYWGEDISKFKIDAGKQACTLTDDQVRNIRQSTKTNVRLARELKVSTRTIYDVRKFKRYKGVV
jgi:hypothetical protein